MPRVLRSRRPAIRIVLVAMLCVLALGLGTRTTSSQSPSAYLRLVQRINTEAVGVAHPAGLSFSPAANAFLLLDPAAQVVLFSPTRQSLGSLPLPEATAGSGLAYDAAHNCLLLLDARAGQLIEYSGDSKGVPRPGVSSRYDTRGWGPAAAQGLSLDPASGRLYILDGMAGRVVRVDPGGGLAYQNAQVSVVNLRLDPGQALQGIAYNSRNGHLYVLNLERQALYELAGDGELVATRELGAAGLKLQDPQGMVFAPSGDQTDDPDNLSLYILDSRRGDPGQRSGQVIELALAPPASVATPAETIVPVLVRTIDTSKWLPPSPDPAGIGYLPAANHLLVTDSEVDEPVGGLPPQYWQGVNLFEMTLDGTLVKTYTTFTSLPTALSPNNFSNEPTDFSFNPRNGRWYFSDDDAQKIFEVRLGQDGVYGTADDVITAFGTPPCGSGDPEGLAVNTGNGHLLVADGINSEIYDIGLGADGIFDGCAPGGDDTVTHFDTASLGVTNPEGIAYNTDLRTVYFVGAPIKVVEATLAGSLVRVIDISAANPQASASIVRAPSSSNPAARSLYITDRGVDNDTDPTENDGKVYEFQLPALSLRHLYLPRVRR